MSKMERRRGREAEGGRWSDVSAESEGAEAPIHRAHESPLPLPPSALIMSGGGRIYLVHSQSHFKVVKPNRVCRTLHAPPTPKYGNGRYEK